MARRRRGPIPGPDKRARCSLIPAVTGTLLWLLTVTLVATASAGYVGEQAAMAAGSGPLPTLDQFYEAVHFPEASAAYVVLVDTSGSMMTDGMYSQVRQYLAGFEKSLSPKDTVTYFTFSSAVSGPYSSARALPPVASGNYTDFGPALAAALSTLSAAADNGVSVGGLFLMSDGIIDAPPTDQAYLTLGSPGWSELRKTAATLQNRMAVTGYGLTMQPTATAGTGASACGGQTTTDPATCAGVQEVLTAIFGPGVLVVSGATGVNISSLLGRAKADERRSKAIRQLLANDAGQGIHASIAFSGAASTDRVQLRGTSVPVTIRLSSQVPDLPLSITGLVVRGTAGADFSITGVPRDISLGPGQTKVLPAKLSWQVPSGRSLFGGSGKISGVITVGGTITSPWLAVIRSDLASSFRLGAVNSGGIRYSATYVKGIDVMTWLAMAVTVVILAGLGLAILLIAFPKLTTDIEVLDLKDDSVRIVRVTGRRRWRGDVEGTLGQLSITGWRGGGARVRFRRELDGATRSGQGRFARNEIAVVASVAFRCSGAAD